MQVLVASTTAFESPSLIRRNLKPARTFPTQIFAKHFFSYIPAHDPIMTEFTSFFQIVLL